MIRRARCSYTFRAKDVVVLTIGSALLFFAYQFLVAWDILSASYYQHLNACSEEIYNFPIKTSSPLIGEPIYGDIELQRSCQAEETEWKGRFLKESHSPGKIYNKCGEMLSPKLLSFKEVRKTNTNESFVVPNIVHYVSLGRWEFSFLNYLSFKSAHLHICPDYIYIHGDGLPFGNWFGRMLKDVANVYQVVRQRPTRIQGRKIMCLEHCSDIIRLQTLYDNGGIYLDTDILVVRSFDPLRTHAVTLGRESAYGLGSGIIIAQPRALFTCVWLHAYRNYNPFPWHWASYAVWTPNRLSRELPAQIHVEERSLQHPSWAEAELLFDDQYEWTNHNYALHIWKRYGNVPTNPEDIRALNTTLGQVMRYIYHGSKKLILDETGVDRSGRFGSKWTLARVVDLGFDKLFNMIGYT